jgi:hypothetical protein
MVNGCVRVQRGVRRRGGFSTDRSRFRRVSVFRCRFARSRSRDTRGRIVAALGSRFSPARVIIVAHQQATVREHDRAHPRFFCRSKPFI